MLAIDRYAWTNRWHAHHPGERLLLAGGGLVLTTLLPPLTAGPMILAVMSLATTLGARVPVGAWLRVMAIPAGFLLTSTPFLALSLDLSDSVRLAYSPAGAMTALDVTLRSLAALSCLTLLVMTTPVIELVALLRRLRVPSAIVEIMLLIYRLIFLFMDEAIAGQHAQTARQGHSTLRRSLRSLGQLIATLLQRALARGRRLEIGLAARGFEGELRVLTPKRLLSWRRLSAAGALLLALAACSLLLEEALR
jgi:cobalt/nickel transport system permease protein